MIVPSSLRKAINLAGILIALSPGYEGGRLAFNSARGDEVDEYVEAQRAQLRIPGLALLVVKDGRTIKAQGYGLANVELQAPVTAESIFQLGSVGKQFTATAVMMLVERGKLAVDDPVNKYLTAAPDNWHAITIRHLLSHTAGVGDFSASFDMRKDCTEDELLNAIFQIPLHSAPGEGWHYSNPGYVALGILIGKVTGQFYGDFLRDQIFRPLGMTATRIISEDDIVPHRAAGYRLVDGELKNQKWVSPTMNSTADGSLYTNLLDMAKWDAALSDKRLLKTETLEQMWTVATLNDGKPNPGNYGFGWFCEEINGHKVVMHSGAWQGFVAHIARYRDDKLTVVMLANLSADSSKGFFKIGQTVAGMYVRELAPARN
jgi:CubicO group peptidase (beta-lactamase class C family)